MRPLTPALSLALGLALVAPVLPAAYGADEPKQTKQRSDVQTGNAKMGLPEYKGIKHAIGCRDFANEANYGGKWQVTTNLTIMLESALFDTGRFVVVEREKLGAVLAEQDLAASGRAAAAKDVAVTGRLRPAKYLATGSLVEVEANESGVGGGIGIGPVRVGGKHNKAQITLIVKLIDTTTGEIVAKERLVGKAGATGLTLGASYGIGSGDIGGFVKTPLGEAAQDCINQAAKFFAKQMEQYPTDGSVVMVSNGKVIINRGSTYNIQPGTVFKVATEGETLTDPDSGAVLDKAPGKDLGTIRVVEVKEKISTCEVVSGEANPPRGAAITLASAPAPAPAEPAKKAD